MKCINSETSNIFYQQIHLSIDYHVLISLVFKELFHFIKICTLWQIHNMSWTKKLIVYLKDGTNLMCINERDEIYILLCEENKIWVKAAF